MPAIQAELRLGHLAAMVLTAVSGVLYGISFPPLALRPLAWIALVPLLLAIRGGSLRRALVLGTLWAFVMTHVTSDCLPAPSSNVKAAARTASVLAMIRTEVYRHAGTLHWLLDDRRTAAKWWQRSFAEGSRLGARPEVARTHVEIAQRIGAESGKPAEVAGQDAAVHREAGTRLLVELGSSIEVAALDAETPREDARESA